MWRKEDGISDRLTSVTYSAAHRNAASIGHAAANFQRYGPAAAGHCGAERGGYGYPTLHVSTPSSTARTRALSGYSVPSELYISSIFERAGSADAGRVTVQCVDAGDREVDAQGNGSCVRQLFRYAHLEKTGGS